MTKTIEEIVNETVEYYSADPSLRGIHDHRGNACAYINSAGNMCAVGRCMLPEALEKYGRCNTDVLGLARHACQTLDTLLKPEYRGHPVEFWKRLQMLHDDACLWNEEVEEREKLCRVMIDLYGQKEGA
jgi:hypothetical protein